MVQGATVAALVGAGCRLALTDHGDVDPATAEWLRNVERGVITPPPAPAQLPPTARGGGPRSGLTWADVGSLILNDRPRAIGGGPTELASQPDSSQQSNANAQPASNQPANTQSTNALQANGQPAGEPQGNNAPGANESTSNGPGGQPPQSAGEQGASTNVGNATGAQPESNTSAPPAPSGPTMESRSFSSPPAPPIHGDPFTLTLGESTVDVTPPTHAQAQPMVLSLEARCGESARPVDEPSPAAVSPFGWLVAVNERASCTGADPTDVAAEAVRQTDARAAGGVMPRGGIVVAKGLETHRVAAIRAGAPTRWPYVLLIDARPGSRGTDELFTGQVLSRVAFLEPRMPREDSPTRQLERQLRERGVETAWFVARRGTDARDGALRRALAWLFVGSDSDLCSPRARSSAAREGRAPMLCEPEGG